VSFLTKYTEFELPESNLLSWHLFRDYKDSGPLGNNLSFISGDISLFSEEKGSFSSHVVELKDLSPTSFTAFFDFKKKDSTAPTVFFSNNSSGLGFFLGCSQGGDFFLYISTPQGSFLRFFETIKVANRAILIFSRSEGLFSLSSFSPISGKIESESIIVKREFDLGSGNLRMGNNIIDSPKEFGNATFDLYQFALIDVGVPSFVVFDLCSETYGSTSRNDFLYKFVSIENKVSPANVEPITGNSEVDTGIVLPYIETLKGFSFFPLVLNSNARFFKNGELFVPTISGSSISYAGANKLDTVILDNFTEGVSTATLGDPFYGEGFGIFPKNKASIFSPKRISEGFVVLDSNSSCYGKRITFKPKTSLINI